MSPEYSEGMKKKTTIVDVARAVGVSPSTVSHAISGKREISTPVKQRIFEKIRELDYRPNFFAQAIKNSSTRLVGIIADECCNPGTAKLIDMLSVELACHSYEAVIDLAGLNLEKGREMLRRFSTGLVDGIINLLPQIDSNEAELLCGAVPVVTLLRDKGAPLQLDYEGMTRRLLEYLWDLGHRRIGYIASRTRRYGLPDPAVKVYAAFMEEYRQPYAGLVAEGQDSIESGMAGAETIFRREPVSAIFTGNDQMAFGVYRWAYEKKISIPEQLSVIGFDDVPQAATMIPPLTTFRFPVREVAEHAVRLLLAKQQKEVLSGEPRILEIEMVIRSSTSVKS